MIDLRNFVQVNLKYFLAKPLNRTRDTVALLVTDQSISNHLDGKYASLAEYEAAISTYNAQSGVTPIVDDAEHPKLYNYLKCFFNNGGMKVHIVGGYTTPVAETDPDIPTWLYTKAKELPYQEIVITSDADEADMRAAQQMHDLTDVVENPLSGVTAVETLSGYKEKLFISSTDNSGLILNPTAKGYDNYIIKFGPKGIEMAAAAYFTQVNVMNSKSISDYCFTPEDVSMFTDEEEISPIVDDNTTSITLANKNFNMNISLVNANRNIYGNTISGLDAMNYFMRIVLTQTLSERIVSVLATKIKYDKSGVNKIINAMTQELNIYKNNGFLSVDDIWTEDDLYFTFNGVDYLVCKRNTPLTSGYKFTILPLSALTAEQKQAHACPPIYVLISDSISIRHILISGDIY